MSRPGLLALVFYASLLRVPAECPSATIDVIKEFWGGKPPRNVLKSNVGTVTYVWMTRSFLLDKLNSGLHCFATNLASDLTTSTDILIYKNRTPVADEITYFQKEKDGIVTLHSHGEPDDTQYVLTHKDHVSTFWQCKTSELDKYDPFVGISVNMAYMDTEAAKQAIENGRKTLDDLKLNTGSALTACKLDYVRT